VEQGEKIVTGLVADMTRVIFDDGGNEGHTFLHNTISRVLVVMGKPAESHNVCVKNARQAAR
jgi:hypothetical protein